MDEARLIQAARDALSNAYAPYSRFAVAAAVVTAAGRVFTGVNVENASYGLTVCAERVAIFCAVAAGETDLAELSLTTAQTPGRSEHAMPCGACRQVMAEFMAPTARIVVDQVGTFSLASLLPDAFVLKP